MFLLLHARQLPPRFNCNCAPSPDDGCKLVESIVSLRPERFQRVRGEDEEEEEGQEEDLGEDKRLQSTAAPYFVASFIDLR